MRELYRRLEGNEIMTIIQNQYCASYGPDDTLLASVDDVRRYAGASALSAIDTLDILFTRNTIWKPNRTGSEFMQNITLKDQQQRNALASSCCSSCR